MATPNAPKTPSNKLDIAGWIILFAGLIALVARRWVPISNMQLFIDEFISKMAEFYPPSGEEKRAWRNPAELEVEEDEEVLR